MVNLTNVCMMNHLILKARKALVDTLHIRVQGGKGGCGLPRYGGVGGKGGDVYVQGSKNRPDNLNYLKKQLSGGFISASDGEAARRTQLLGKSGNNLYIKVPLGVTVSDENRQHLGDINEVDEKVIVALGGRGGDKLGDYQGFVGQKRVIRLELKIISDAVLVGFPNAGKSSLLRAISDAKPTIASYPFTTLKPQLGHINFDDYRSLTIADLPGIVEGAHKNLGLGHDFLKHMERTRLLIFLIDITGVDLGPEYKIRTPFETLCILNKELELYNDHLLKKPAILAISKMDTVSESRQLYREFKETLRTFQKYPESIDGSLRPNQLINFDEILSISSHNGLNIDKLKRVIRDVIDKYAEADKLSKDKITSYKELIPSEYNRLDLRKDSDIQ